MIEKECHFRLACRDLLFGNMMTKTRLQALEYKWGFLDENLTFPLLFYYFIIFLKNK